MSLRYPDHVFFSFFLFFAPSTYPSIWWPKEAGSFTLLPKDPSAPVTANSTSAELLASTPIACATFTSLPNPHPTILLYLNTKIAALIEQRPTEEAAQAAHELLARLVGEGKDGIPQPSHAVMTDWTKDPYALGATTTPSVVGEGRLVQLLASLSRRRLALTNPSPVFPALQRPTRLPRAQEARVEGHPRIRRRAHPCRPPWKRHGRDGEWSARGGAAGAASRGWQEGLRERERERKCVCVCVSRFVDRSPILPLDLGSCRRETVTGSHL